METPQTTGQAVNPKENMPTDNQGTENKPAQPKDSNRPNVGFGEETVQDKKNDEEIVSFTIIWIKVLFLIQIYKRNFILIYNI